MCSLIHGFGTYSMPSTTLDEPLKLLLIFALAHSAFIVCRHFWSPFCLCSARVESPTHDCCSHWRHARRTWHVILWDHGPLFFRVNSPSHSILIICNITKLTNNPGFHGSRCILLLWIYRYILLKLVVKLVYCRPCQCPDRQLQGTGAGTPPISLLTNIWCTAV